MWCKHLPKCHSQWVAIEVQHLQDRVHTRWSSALARTEWERWNSRLKSRWSATSDLECEAPALSCSGSWDIELRRLPRNRRQLKSRYREWVVRERVLMSKRTTFVRHLKSASSSSFFFFLPFVNGDKVAWYTPDNLPIGFRPRRELDQLCWGIHPRSQFERWSPSWIIPHCCVAWVGSRRRLCRAIRSRSRYQQADRRISNWSGRRSIEPTSLKLTRVE